jgi:predicted metallo-beta-lactamase superfamily hydrolase
MAEETVPVEIRRVHIDFTFGVNPRVPVTPEAEMPGVDEELVEAVRRELIRSGSRNPDIFGGRA